MDEISNRIYKTENITEVICVLDKSGSMGLVKKETIEGFNNLIKEQKKNKNHTFLTLTLFSDDYDIMFRSIDINKIKPLTPLNYKTEGQTALYDAICATIDACEEEFSMKYSYRTIGHAKNRSESLPKVIMAILTDGDDNCSARYNHKDVFKRITKMSKFYNWEFIFLTADKDVFKKPDLGIPGTNTIIFDPKGGGTLHAFNTMTQFIRRRNR